MTIRMLRFSDDDQLERFSLCGVICCHDRDDFAPLDGATVALWKWSSPAPENADFRLILETSDDDHDHWHFHVDASRRGLPNSASFCEVQLTQVEQLLERLAGEMVDASVTSRYSIPATMIPAHGIIQGMRHLRTEAGGATMTLSGATMSIKDDIFTEVSWKICEDTIRVTLEAETESPVGEGYFEAISTLMRGGLDRFVFERRGRIENAIHERPSLPPAKGATA